MKTLVAAFALVFVFVGAVSADVVHGGVPVTTLVPSDLALAETIAPIAEGHPVRLVYRRAQTTALVVDVLVAANARHANDALDLVVRSFATPPSPLSGVGDRAFTSPRSIAFVRDNVMIAMRAIGDEPLAPLTAHVDAAIRASTAGPTHGSASLSAPRQLARGVATPLSAIGDVLTAQIRVAGPAYARRTRDGWVVTRTGEGTVTVHALTIDSRLRAASR